MTAPSSLWRLARTALAAVSLLLVGSTAHADGDREIILHAFRAPSTGVEFREGFLGLHVGLYPAIVDKNDRGAARTTWFLKTGLTAYFLGFDTGSGRNSSPYVSLSLVQGFGNAWDVTRSVTEGTGVAVDAGFRWAAWRGLDLRLGRGVMVGFDGRVKLNPTPGISRAIPLDAPKKPDPTSIGPAAASSAPSSPSP